MNFDLVALDFDNIKKALKHFTKTPYGKEAVSEMMPAPALVVAQQMQNSVTSARKRVDGGQVLDLGDVPNILAALRQASTPGAILSSNALLNILYLLQAAISLKKIIEDDSVLYPVSMPEINIPNELLDQLLQCISDAGRLKKDASTVLSDLNEELANTRLSVEQTIKEFSENKKNKPYIIKSVKIAWQGERAVVIVKPENLKKIQGVIKGSRAGGVEQLVEPLIVVAGNNQLERVSQKIFIEQQNILRALTAEVNKDVNQINDMVNAITWVDIAFAAAHLSQQMNAHPPALTNNPSIMLDQAYHPTLLIQFIQGKLSHPVPLSIKLDSAKPFVLITGLNTGGKTVVLKTVGLLQIIAQCGLHIPAEGDCEMGWFNTIMVDMGDKQSMYHQLSTFAGHVEVMKLIMNNADEKALFLLDELGTGTDPEEGAALAMSVIDHLIDKKSLGIVNTHLSPLKTYAASHDSIQNAAMSFDQKTLCPSYQLSFGCSGQSYGLLIAKRNGLSPEVIEKAENYLRKIKSAKSG